MLIIKLKSTYSPHIPGSTGHKLCLVGQIGGFYWGSFCFHFHHGLCNSNPLILGGVEPSQSEVVPAVEVGVLAMREPPSALVVLSTVGVRDVAIGIFGAELHPVLIGEGVASVSRES